MKRVLSTAVATLLSLCTAVWLWTGDTRAQAPAAPAPAAPATQGPGPGRGVGGSGLAQTPAGRGGPPAVEKKHVLVIGNATGFHHGSISDGLGTIWQLGKESGAYDTEIKTDTKWLSKQPDAFSGEGHNLDYFDVLVAVSPVGSWELNDQQKKDLLAFVRDDGNGFVGIHGALDANHEWPEYLEMIGGEFVGHPWNTFAAPVIIEDPSFPAMRHFPATHLTITDEMYMTKGPWSRDKVNVLMRLDETRLNYDPGRGRTAGAGRGATAGAAPVTPPAPAAPPETGRGSLRDDRDFAITWAKTYGKGRVFYTSLGHVKEAFTDPDIRKMYLEAIKWAAGLTEGSTAPHKKL